MAFFLISAFALAVAILVKRACLRPFIDEIKEIELIEHTRAARIKKDKANEKANKGTVVRLGEALEKVFPLTRATEEKYRLKLERAGLKISPGRAHGIVFILTLAGFAIGVILCALTHTDFWLSLALSVGSAFLTRLLCASYLLDKTKKRKRDIEKNFPDALDNLRCIVSAGVSFDEAFGEVARAKPLGAIAEEFGRVNLEMNVMNLSREEALDNMATRCDTPDVHFFCAAIAQATREGTSISAILAQQSRNTRMALFGRLREEIGKIDTKMSFPLVTCIMSATMLLLIAPIVVQVANSFTSMF